MARTTLPLNPTRWPRKVFLPLRTSFLSAQYTLAYIRPPHPKHVQKGCCGITENRETTASRSEDKHYTAPDRSFFFSSACIRCYKFPSKHCFHCVIQIFCKLRFHFHLGQNIFRFFLSLLLSLMYYLEVHYLISKAVVAGRWFSRTLRNRDGREVGWVKGKLYATKFAVPIEI